MTNTEVGGASTVPALVEADYGISAECGHERFTETGWARQGESDVSCSECGADDGFVVYRKKYATRRDDQRYWAIVCRTCQTVDSLDAFDAESKKLFRSWEQNLDSRATADRAVLPPAEEMDPPASRAEQRSNEETNPEEFQAILLAARAEVAASKGSLRTSDVGRVEIVEDGRGRQLRVAAPEVDLSEQPFGELFVAASRKAESRIRVTKVLHASRSEAAVEIESGATPGDGAHLFIQIDPSLVAEAFLRQLESCKSLGLATVLLDAGDLVRASPFDTEELNQEQSLAVGHLLASGASAVWGPPGTGKTRVIGVAIAELLRRGRTVAIVSNTNVAVDQALLNVFEATDQPEPGQIVRVGNAAIPEIANHPVMSLSRAVASQHQNLMAKLAALESKRAHAKADEQIGALERLNLIMGTRDLAGLKRIADNAQLRRLAGPVASELEQAGASAEAASATLEDAEANLAATQTELAAVGEYLWLPDAEQDAEDLNSQVNDASKRSDDLAKRILDASRQPLLTRYRVTKQLKVEQQSMSEHRRKLSAKLSSQRGQLAKARADGVNADRVRQAVRAERDAHAERKDLAVRHGRDKARVTRLATKFRSITDLPPASAQERAVEDLIEEIGSPKRLVNQRDRIHKAVTKRLTEIRGLSAEITIIEHELSNLAESMVKDAPVVGTTLAQLVVHPGLVGRRFDHVILDEASAALPPYAVSALSKADRGIGIVGDFEQNMPICTSDLAKVNAAARPWLDSDPFGRLGITDAASAESEPGCVVLKAQYRFGDAITNLANAVAYGGLLRRESDLPRDDPEIVIVDTTSLGEAAHVERGLGGKGRWWAAGTAATLEVARTHGFEGVGVVTPYRAQVQLTRSRMIDLGASVQVGTAHAFQGREFPVVVLDLVEDGGGQSWVARASKTGSRWSRDGVRLFNVGMTRASNRLYIVGSLGQILRSKAGPLFELGRLVDHDSVDVWDAAEMIGGQSIHTGQGRSAGGGGSGSEWHGVPSSPTMFDDETFYERLTGDLETVQDRVVVFSPFVARARVQQILPQLAALAARGVKVTAFTKATRELSDPGLLDEVRNHGIIVRERQGMHEKVVIIDETVAYVGSLNTLSNTGRTGEIMMRFAGAETTARIAQFMKSAAKR